MRVLCLILLFASAGPFLWAQDFRHAVEEAQKAYGQMDRVHAVMRIKAYEHATDAVPHYSEMADIKRDGQNYLYRFGETHMLMNDKFILLVDESNKEISYSKRDLAGEAALLKDPVKMTLDSLLKRYKQTTYLGEKDLMAQYQLEADGNGQLKTNLYFDVRTKLIRRIEYHYAEGQYVLIEFLLFNKAPHFPPDTFHEKHYIIIGKTDVMPSPGFKGYHITNAENQ